MGEFSMRLHVLLILALLPVPRIAAAETESQIEFFEKRIRPVLVEHCHECHSAQTKSVKGQLRVDHREAIRAGGESGPAVVPGKPDESVLLSAMRYESLEMPPAGKLPDDVIRDFERWIRDGAIDPREGVLARQPASIDMAAGKHFWSFQPVKPQPIPSVEDKAWPQTNIDHFILARLEQAKLSPSPAAQPEALGRRIFFDVVGLPPTRDQLARFVADRSPDAVLRLVDSLLASPEYGPHWGRRWLDLARYADSSGGGRTRILHDAWRYRDYVIDAFNDDLRYDEFITEQLAGDLLQSETRSLRSRRLTATGFLSLGPTNYELQDKELLRMEVVDEQLDTIGRSLLGMTIGCARCHDHKFDPIPTSDYYALAGILRSTKSLIHANVSDFVQRELPLNDELQAKVDEHNKVQAQMVEDLARHRDVLKRYAHDKSAKLDGIHGNVVDDSSAQLVGQWKQSTHSPRFVEEGYLHDGGASKGLMSARFVTNLPQSEDYEVRVSYSAGPNRSPKVPVKIIHSDGEATVFVDQTKPPPIDQLFISLGRFRFSKQTPAQIVIENMGTTNVVIVDAVQFISDSLVPQLGGQDEHVARQVADAQRAINQLEDDIKRHKTNAPFTPKVMSVMEESEPADFCVCIRGNVHNLGEVVPRGFLSVVDYVQTESIPEEQSGRRELAAWICSPRNPLTARIIVNRAWHHLLGAGLVRTPDNFGSTGEVPTHPELLDHLAVEFVRHDWSVKWLIREIVRSSVYQMCSDDDPAGMTVDPENRLLWRAHRRRLSAEQIHDAVLSISGNLDRRMRGSSVARDVKSEFGYVYQGSRRGVYRPIFRNQLMDLFEVFDVADPNIVVGRRNVSTRPTQALFMMNSSFVLENSERLARQIDGFNQPTGEKIDLLYQTLLGRSPTEEEVEQTLTFWREIKQDVGDSSVQAWAAIVQSLLACVDFRYVR